MFLILPLEGGHIEYSESGQESPRPQDSWELRSVEGAQDGGKEKAPPCLVAAAGALSTSPPTEIQLEPAHAGMLPARQKQVASGHCWSVGGMDGMAAALLMGEGARKWLK